MLLNYRIYSESIVNFGAEYIHPALADMLQQYIRIRDCLDNRVKKKTIQYLPDPSEVIEDETIRKRRYASYLARAVWLPATKRTQQGLVGQVFIRKPAQKLGKITQADADKIGIRGESTQQLSHYALTEIVGMGRGALVFNITQTFRPVLDFIETENILSWSDLDNGEVDDIGRNYETCLVRSFSEIMNSDGLTLNKVAKLTQYRLDVNKKAWFRYRFSTSNSWSSYAPFIVNGEHLGHIPVYPIGAEENSFDIHPSPLEELAEINLSHYISTADYEEHVKVAGQAMLVIKGLEQTWYEKNIDGKIAMGVRRPLPLAKDSDAHIIQAQPNSTAKEAMDKKEQMMVAVGGRLIEQRQVRRTATEADMEAQSYHSILGKIANNVSIAFTTALRDIEKLYTTGENVDEGDKPLLTLNQDFGTILTDAEHRRLALEEYIKGLLTFDEYRTILRNYVPTISPDSEKVKTEIENEVPFREKMVQANNTKTEQTPELANQDNRSK